MPVANKTLVTRSKGTLGVLVVSFDCDNSYPAGGYPFDLSPYGCTRPHFVTFMNTQGFEGQYNRANKTVQFFGTATAVAITSATEVAGGADLSALVGVRAIVFYDR